MIKPQGKIRALLATARLPNVPSVVVNVLTGAAFAGAAAGGLGDPPWLAFAGAGAAGVAIYVSGNFLNDWHDRGWDAARRPERALPRGLFRPGTYLRLAIGLAAGGLGLAAFASSTAVAVAAAIIGLVVFYTLIHKKTAWSVIPMGLCRAALPCLGAAAVNPELTFSRPVMLPALALLAYIAGLSLAARGESLAGGREPVSRWPARMLLATPMVMAVAPLWLRSSPDHQAWFALLAYAGWILVCERVRRVAGARFVPLLLAGIPLVDWMFLWPLGLAGGGGFAWSCLLVPPLAVIAALLLQRMVPAT